MARARPARSRPARARLSAVSHVARVSVASTRVSCDIPDRYVTEGAAKHRRTRMSCDTRRLLPTNRERPGAYGSAQR
ncbi:hypothetical protein MIPYR_70017 [uncultured Microbacterium sp.]|uniref:Uncharacterized protein n=1 Tax=uncultured Microbacterium sp. TaxID=191216 RepID=A0A1Y5P7C1_9MICO|nr:hypothetical protein MIPYR_70017 [uncultured Microbacterium sp.]